MRGFFMAFTYIWGLFGNTTICPFTYHKKLKAMTFGVIVFPGSNCDKDTVYVLEHLLEQQVVELWHRIPNFLLALMPLCFRAVFPTATICARAH